LRQVADVSNDIEAVFAIVARLAQDVEPSVRAELMEQVPHIAMYCQELPDSMHQIVPSHLLPLVVKFLTDTNNQVRKTSQAALLVLLEQGLVDKADVEEQVCPVILRLTESDSMDDYRTEAVALLSKMAPLIGREMSQRLFLQRFATLCVDPLFHVRKVCAANFGDFSGVVGSDPTEQTLLPKFFYLCEDGVWGVRKACADVFMPVSCVCSPTVRQTELSPLFINLLRDQSRWVRMAAFQALGPFISTFADPAITALLHNENGEIVITDPDQLAERLNTLEKERGKNDKLDSQSSQKLKDTSLSQRTSSQNIENINNNNTSGAKDTENNNNTVHMDTAEDSWGSELVARNTQTSAEEERASRYLESEGYSTFLYWRDPVADLVDIDLAEQEEELEVVKTELSNLDLESSTDDDGCGNKTAVEKTETEEDVSVEESEKEDLPEKGSSKEELDNAAAAESNSAPETDGAVDNKQKIDDNENKTAAVDNETQEDKASEEKGKKIGESTEDVDEEEEEGREEGGSMWRTLPVITFQKFDDLTESTDSTMELYRPEDVSKAQVSISTFEPGSSRWETYSNSSLHSSRSSLDSSRSQDPVPPDPALPRGPPETDQSIVPQLLIDHYVSMIDPSRAQTVDNDIARHCAFSLPAVALTLGRTNWPLLKETYESLANDMQWKVRRTLASSIHELGVILGEDVASTDLVPIFNGFIKDLDEVRIGVLKHLADFLKLLGEEERNSYLPRLEEFLKMDNERNWRFRLELTEQLGILVPIFSADQLTEHLAPIAITLVQDKVAAVRKAATQVLSVMLGSLQSAGELELCRNTVASLVSCLANSSHWTRRQTYAQLVGQLVATLPWQEVSAHLLPHLLNLSEDRVPNVRLQVANVIGHVLSEEWYADTSCPEHERLTSSLTQLAGDKDADVREAACSGGRVEPKPPPRELPPPDPVVVSGLEQHCLEQTSLEEPLPTWAQIAEVIQEKI